MPSSEKNIRYMLHFILENMHANIFIKYLVFLHKMNIPRITPHYESTGSHGTICSLVNLKWCSCEGGYLEVSCILISFSLSSAQIHLKCKSSFKKGIYCQASADIWANVLWKYYFL